MTHRSGPLRIAPLAILALVAMGPGCVASPQPSPPNLSSDMVRVDVDPAADRLEGLRIFGAPGTVDPPEGSVVLTDLDSDSDPVAEPVRADGSFEIVIPAPPGHELRLQVRNGGARSEPVDLIPVLDDPVPIRAPRPLDCLVLTPAAELDFGAASLGAALESRVRIANDCAEDVELIPARFREATGPFAVTGDVTRVAAGGEAELVVEAVPDARGTTERTLFVEAASPLSDRRPLTLFVMGAD